jgi:hypothetical protein
MPYLADAFVGWQPEKDAEQLLQLHKWQQGVLISFKNTWIRSSVISNITMDMAADGSTATLLCQ